jgi:hypothetical protein
VARGAVEWFETGAGAAEPGASLEALYYRVLLDPNALPDEPALLRALADHLGTAAGDLPAAAQARLREASGRVLSREEIHHLVKDARHRAIRHRQSAQASLGLESAVVSDLKAGLVAGFDPLLARDFAVRDPLQPLAQRKQATSLPPAEVIQSMFAAGEFDVLATLAVPAAVALLEDLLAGSGVWLEPDPLHHPAYACALATLADRVGHGFGPGFHEWLARPGLMSKIREVLAPAAVTRGGGPAAAATMVLRIAGVDPGLPDPGNDAPVEDLARWRVWLAGSAPATRSPPVMLSALPLFDPEILAAAGIVADRRTNEREVEALRRLRSGTESARLRDLTQARGDAARMALRLGLGVVRAESIPRLLPGRRPELYPPLRGFLERHDRIGGLAAAVERIEGELPWWPLELRSNRLAAETGITLHALIDTVDLFGRLEQFVKDLAGAPDAAPGLHRLAVLMERFGAVWSSRFVGAAA